MFRLFSRRTYVVQFVSYVLLRIITTESGCLFYSHRKLFETLFRLPLSVYILLYQLKNLQ